MKLQPRKIAEKEKIKYLDYLYTSIASLKSREEVKNFLRDLLTESERIMLGRRILIAERLLAGDSYDKIIDELKVGKDTIGRVYKWLNDKTEGYEDVVKRLQKELSNRKTKIGAASVKPFSFVWLKKKYPLHFLLFNLIDEFGKSRKAK